MKIYFDNAATTPVLPFTQTNIFGNPSSPHNLGIDAERKLTHARQMFSKYLNCAPRELIFTSGATESNNLALIGFALANQRKKATFMAEPWEHPSVLEPLKFIKDQNLGNVIISPHEEWIKCSADIRLAAISHVNHEIGTINDISTIAAKLKMDNMRTTVLADGAQGFCKESTNLSHVDMYSFSAHKSHGPTGVGGLIVSSKTRLVPLVYGGGQENNLRAGTENVSGILHFLETAQHLWETQTENSKHVAKIKLILEEISNELPDVTVNIKKDSVSPYILNMSFIGLKGETLIHLLSERGVFASMGAACRSRKNTKSALEIMGFPPEQASSAIRFSFSHLNTMEEAIAAKAIIIDCVTQLRKMLGTDRT